MSGTRRELVHQHLMHHPDLTAHEVARALRLPSAGSVAKLLHVMAGDGEAVPARSPRTESDHRPAIRWRAT